jgi:Tol biopolymer transport system component
MDFKNLRIEPAKSVAFARDATLQTMAVATVHEDQLEQTAVVTTTKGLSDVAWSTDGKSLTYKSGGATWRVPAEGMETRAPEKVADAATGPRENAKLVFYADPKSGALWQVKSDGTGRAQILPGGDQRYFSPHVSPDGKWVVFASAPAGMKAGRSGDVEIHLMQVGGKPVTMAKIQGGADALDFNPWSPDSRSFAFISRQPGT